jgi:hypothetical protein
MVPFGRSDKDVHIAHSPLRSYLPRLVLTLTRWCLAVCARGLSCSSCYLVYTLALGTAVPSIVLGLLQ